MQIDETTLDLLHNLTTKRAAEINEKGSDYTIEGAERTFRVLVDESAKSFRVLPGIALRPGTVIKRAGSYDAGLFVTEVKTLAGCTEAAFERIAGTLTVLSQKGAFFVPGGQVPFFLLKEGPAVAAYQCPAIGSIVTRASGTQEVITSVMRHGPFNLVRLSPYRPEPAKSLSRHAEMPRHIDFPQAPSIDFSH